MKNEASLDLQSHIFEICETCDSMTNYEFEHLISPKPLDIGATALMLAAINDHLSIVKILLDAKASVMIFCDTGIFQQLVVS